ncbi:MAG: uncharacterized protein PWQ93_1361 [Clostridiales bacterium]|nr:uncharacterized protein [Clostridiales bacterium]
MPRPPKTRFVEDLPYISLFKPMGIPMRQLEEVVLSIEEFEAIRLKDLEGLEQKECAQRMQISRPTFQRILVTAHQKIAEALIDGKALRIEGGNYQVTKRHFRCASCGYEFEEPYGTGRGCDMVCPQCHQKTIYRVDSDGGEGMPNRSCKRRGHGHDGEPS